MPTAHLKARKPIMAALGAALVLGIAPAADASGQNPLGATLQVRSAETGPQAARAGFDRRYLLKTARYVISDMRTINTRLRDGISVSSAFYILSDSYGYMSNAGVPPKIVKKARYKARLATLSDFANLAGDEYYDDETAAIARYSVIRKQTKILFNQVNTAIGSDLRVP